MHEEAVHACSSAWRTSSMRKGITDNTESTKGDPTMDAVVIHQRIVLITQALFASGKAVTRSDTRSEV